MAQDTWRSSSDPIRIVPLAGAIAEAPAAAPAQLTYRGGPLLAGLEVFTVFWGDDWDRSQQSSLADRLNAFFDAVLGGPLLQQLGEYDTADYSIQSGRRTGSVQVPGALSGVVADAAVRTMLHEQLAGGSVPAVTPDTLYFVYLPPGVDVEQGGARSCQSFCGYHDADGDLYYAVMPYPGCSGCTSSLSEFDALTSTSSHELCEAITDPVPGQGWYDDAQGEIGDICAWQTKQLDGYTVQLEWSNQAGACM
jgi:hypothetical protein